MKRAPILALALLLVVAIPGVAVAKGVTVQKVRGDLAAADESEAAGKFVLTAVTSGDRGFERLDVVAKGLDPDAEYEVLLGESLDDAVSFGEMKVRGKRGYGRLRFHSRRDDYPEGVDALADLSGGAIFVRSGDETVLEGEIPDFVSPGTGDEAGEGSFAAGFGAAKLTPTEDGDSHAGAFLEALALVGPGGAREFVGIQAWMLDPDQDYGVFLVGEDGADDDELGTLDPRGRFGVAFLKLDTGRDDELPAHLAALGGRTVEVRDEAGGAVLTGTFPELR